MKKQTMFDNAYADQFFGEPKSIMGKGFIGMHEETQRCMNKKKPRKLFPSVENFI